MKYSYLFSSLCVTGACFTLPLSAQISSDTGIIGSISTGEPTVSKKAAKKKVKIDFRVKNTFQQKVGKRNVTLHEVEAPVLPDTSTQTDSHAHVNSPLGAAADTEPQEVEPTKIITILATTYGKGDEKRTCLRLWHEGKVSEAWTNISGDLLEGFSGFRANGREYMLIFGNSMALTDKGEMEGLDAAAQQGCPLNHRVFKSKRAGFVVTKLEESDESSRTILYDLHHLYRIEKDNLKQARDLRKQNASLKKDAPISPAKDVTIRFWKRDMEAERKSK